MLKRNLFALALAGLCAFSFVACDDDNDKDKDKDKVSVCADKNEGDSCGDNKVCNASKECVAKSTEDPCKDKNEGDACGDKKICDASKACVDDPCADKNVNDSCGDKKICNASKKCVADPCADKSAGDKCGDNDLTYCDDSKKCVAVPTDCASDTSCKANAYNKCDTDAGKCYKVNDAYVASCGAEGGKEVYLKGEWIYADKSTENKVLKDVCDGNTPKCIMSLNGCGTDVFECTQDTDCANVDPSKPYCDNKVCVAEKPGEVVDPCKDVSCEDGVCDRHICVTDAMKAYTKGGACNAESFQSFCDGDKAVSCASGKIVVDDCAGDDVGKCTAVENWGHYEAACTNNEKAIALCEANESSASPASTINVCYGKQDWVAEVICTTDVYNKLIALAMGVARDCNGTACSYDGDEPTCK